MRATLRYDDRDGPARLAQAWTRRACPVDLRVLEHATAPVLDVGCGPGRHCEVLAERGEVVLGIDITPPALDLARRRRVSVLHRDVFDRIPGVGRWATVLLLDGNIGIGGCPATLLTRCVDLLRDDGAIIVEVADDSTPPVERARLEVGARAGPWFRWCAVEGRDLEGIAATAGLAITRTWSDDDRSFAILARPKR